MNLAHLLARIALLDPSRPAVAVGDSLATSYAELARRAAGFGSSLRASFGLSQGDRVLLLMSNGPEFPEVLFGCWWGGLTPVPINTRLHPKEIAYIASNCGARAAVTTAELGGALNEALDALGGTTPVIEVGTAAYRAHCEAPPSAIASVAPTDLAWLFYTSGTTGKPKGAMLTHRNLLAMSSNYFVDIDTIGLGDCILHAAPMSHGSGMYMLPHIAAGALQVIPQSRHFEPAEIFEIIRRHTGVSMFAAPTMVKRLVDDSGAGGDTTNLKSLIYGGGPMYVADCRAALAAFGPKLVQIYGQGESPMTITVLPKWMHVRGDTDAALASVGYAQSVVEVKTAEAETELPSGAPGEVLVRGDTVMAGYWNDETTTASTLRDGWLHTGDVGVVDKRGLLTLKDRSKDLIISGGSNIYPREIEEVLLTHNGVSEAAVIGAPDPQWGERVVAYIVARGGAAIPQTELDEICSSSIARFKRPREYRFVADLPKNNYGKVLKTALRSAETRRAAELARGGH